MNRIIAIPLLLLAIAQPLPSQAQAVPAHVTNALHYPTSSQRFFEEGREQFEVEIHQLQQQPLQAVVLDLNPDLLEQQERLRQEQELRPEEQIHQDGDPTDNRDGNS